ncbi:MAG: hypothetical protein IJK04_07215 [Kiritimatiellae bacterium]|nr:hypothetical protein [Kiritimatiellia bacterium]
MDSKLLSRLVGDGVADDTDAIQALLDSGAGCVYLPPPKVAYLISRTLKIGSGQELRLDRFSLVRLAPKSDCPMLENRAFRGGKDVRLAVTGGIWDADNVSQTGNFQQLPGGRAAAPKSFDQDFFIGMAMRFNNVEEMRVGGLTVRNPVSYGIEFGHAAYVVAEDIAFDYNAWNPIPLNMDGVHFDGFCHHLRIANLRGTCFDDMVALNANDGICSPEEGPIHDVDIDGLYCEYCHSAVRMLSAGAPLGQVTVRNVHGHFYCYTVGLTHYFPEKPRGRFDDIVVSDVFASKANVPPECGGESYRNPMEVIHLQGPIDVGNLVVERLYRDEDCLPASTIGIDAKATVENLAVRDCRMTNRLPAPIKFIDNRGRIDSIVTDNNRFYGNWTSKES